MKTPWLKPGVAVGALVPLAWMVADAVRGTLGADPIAIALNRLGLLALIFLWASLACTPARLAFGVAWPVRIRRMLGLLAFFHALLHFSLYAFVDQGLDWAAITEDVTKRGFITVGFVAFVLLIPLAATSTKGMVKRLGAARWKKLHRMSYVVAILATVHFVWRVKKDLSQPLVYAVVLGVLLAVRVADSARRRARAVASGEAG